MKPSGGPHVGGGSHAYIADAELFQEQKVVGGRVWGPNCTQILRPGANWGVTAPALPADPKKAEPSAPPNAIFPNSLRSGSYCAIRTPSLRADRRRFTQAQTDRRLSALTHGSDYHQALQSRDRQKP